MASEIPGADIIGISNPAALISEVEESGDVYNVLVNLGLNYQLNEKFKVGGISASIIITTGNKPSLPAKVH